MNTNELRERASKAFDAEFRDRLCNAVQVHILNEGRVRPSVIEHAQTSIIEHVQNCKCPQGCLFESEHLNYPLSIMVQSKFGFKWEQHFTFQSAFDDGCDNETPEAALGLLYRKRFIK